VIKYNLPLGKNYLYIPRGPISSRRKVQSEKLRSEIKNLEELAGKEKSIFLRIEPINDIPEASLKESGFVKTKDIQPAKTLVLDLGASEEELFSRMHEKTRYNIGLAQRKGVKIRKAEFNEKDFEIFWDIINKTAKRQGIRIFPKEYYRKELQIGKNLPQPLLREGSSLPLGRVREDFQNLLFIAEFEGKPIAANLVNIFGKTATYLHGGSDNEFRSFMAPHLLQWEQIKEAKNQGCLIYDFWGYDEQKWPGVSRFKRGFGGREASYPGCFDYLINKIWFLIYKLARKIL
jgi:lipid II:glycine glycyltransferase (peptidoglycan interpeptide bridge formation enzyme)